MSKSLEQTASALLKGAVTYTGDILEQTEDTVTIKFKKPRSSKYTARTFNTSDVIAIHSSAEEGSSQVVVEEESEAYSDQGEVTVSSGWAQVGDTAFNLNHPSVNLQIEATAESIENYGAKTKKKPARRKKK